MYYVKEKINNQYYVGALCLEIENFCDVYPQLLQSNRFRYAKKKNTVLNDMYILS